MNEYNGYTLTYITINPDMSLTGNVHCDSYFKTTITAKSIETFMQKFHHFVDEDIKQTNCQNFTKELIMNEYNGYTLVDITINPNISLSGKIYHLSEFKKKITESTIENFRNSFHKFVDEDIKKQSDLTNRQNFARELVELCKKHKVELSTDSDSYLYVDGHHLFWKNTDNWRAYVNAIDGSEHGDVSCT